MAISSPSAGRPGGVGGSPKKFPEKFSDNGVRDKHHRVSDVSVTSFWITSRRVAVHVVPGTRAQVYTRDATHRPTATSTPGRGAFLRSWSGVLGVWGSEIPEFPEICRNLSKFPKKVKKSEKKGLPARAGGGFSGVLDPPRGVKFDEISRNSRKKSLFDPPPGGGQKPPNLAQKPPPGGGVKSHFLTFWVAGASASCCIAPDLEARPFPQT